MYRYNPKTLAFEKVKASPPPPPPADPYDTYGSHINPNTTYTTKDGSTIRTGSLAGQNPYADANPTSVATGTAMPHPDLNKPTPPPQPAFDINNPGAISVPEGTGSTGVSAGGGENDGAGVDVWGGFDTLLENWTSGQQNPFRGTLPGMNDPFPTQRPAQRPAQPNRPGANPARPDQPGRERPDNKRPRHIDDLLPGASRWANMPAPEGFRYAINPNTKAVELIDISGMDRSQKLQGWKWMPDNPKNPNSGRWLWMPGADILENPYEGIPSAVVPWVQQALEAGGDVNVVPEGPARAWVSFLLQQLPQGQGRAPEDLPFGLGMPRFDPNNSNVPSIPSRGPSEAGMALLQAIQSGEGAQKVYAALKKYIKAVSGENKKLPMPISIDDELEELGLTPEQIQDLIALYTAFDDERGDGRREERPERPATRPERPARQREGATFPTPPWPTNPEMEWPWSGDEPWPEE
jgi:hypothetical protein